MAICSFLGHRSVYDVDVDIRLQKAVDDVVSRSETVDFWLHPQEEFFYCCLLAVLRAKSRNPQKVKVCLTIMGEAQYASFMQQESWSVPGCMVDKITMYHMDHIESRDCAKLYKMLLRYVIQKSTYVISSLYERLYTAERHILNFARKTPDLEIISITSAETEEKITEYEKDLSEKELRILHKMNAGSTLKKAGDMLGVGSERTRQILRHGCSKISGKLELRYKQECLLSGQKNYSCGILSLGEGTYDTIKRFEHITSFLTENFHIRTFYIERHYAKSAFMAVLNRQCHLRGNCHITAVTDEDVFVENNEDNDDLYIRYCPPCDAVECVGWADRNNERDNLRIIANITGRSDFCIFDSSSAFPGEKMRQRINPERRTVFLDISEPGIIKKLRKIPGPDI